MTTMNRSRPTAPATDRRDRAGHLFLVAGGAAFFIGGPMHPQGSDEGDKTEQLHSMLVDSAWYPAHLVALLGFACVAAGLLALGRDPTLRDRLGRLLTISAWVAVVATVGAVVHLFAATQAADVEQGDTTPLVAAFMGVETVVNPVWGLTIAALAVVGGLTRALGNRLVLPLGLLGGLAFALATATIAFVDTFDPLFPVAGLAGVWLVATGIAGLVRRPQQAPTTPEEKS
jgi:cytochrome bd-type quinol oxidase subunit 2